MYREPTDTNLTMQYTSTCPKAWKLGVIRFYLNRALNISFNILTFEEELFNIKAKMTELYRTDLSLLKV